MDTLNSLSEVIKASILPGVIEQFTKESPFVAFFKERAGSRNLRMFEVFRYAQQHGYKSPYQIFGRKRSYAD